MAIIRSSRATNRFYRDFLVKSEENIRANLTTAASKQWLSIRLQLLGSLFVGFAAFTSIITSSHITAPEISGLVLSYALSISTLLSGVLNAVIETEQVPAFNYQDEFSEILIFVKNFTHSNCL